MGFGKNILIPDAAINEQLNSSTVEEIEVGVGDYDWNASAARNIRGETNACDGIGHKGNWRRCLVLRAIVEICHRCINWMYGKVINARFVQSWCITDVLKINVDFDRHSFLDLSRYVVTSHQANPSSLFQVRPAYRFIQGQLALSDSALEGSRDFICRTDDLVCLFRRAFRHVSGSLQRLSCKPTLVNSGNGKNSSEQILPSKQAAPLRQKICPNPLLYFVGSFVCLYLGIYFLSILVEDSPWHIVLVRLVLGPVLCWAGQFILGRYVALAYGK
jgi:hypothetical protein